MFSGHKAAIVRLQPLHRYATYYVDVDAAYCYRRSSVACLSVCRSVSHDRKHGKNGQTERDTVWVVDSGVPMNHVLDGGPDAPLRRGNFKGEVGGRI